MSKWFCFLVVLFASIGSDFVPTPFAVELLAQQRPASSAGSDAALPKRVGISEEQSLTLGDAITQALRNNPEVAISRIEMLSRVAQAKHFPSGDRAALLR